MKPIWNWNKNLVFLQQIFQLPPVWWQVIKCQQKSSNANKSHQMPSKVIKCQQKSSNAIKSHQMPTKVIKCHQKSSNANQIKPKKTIFNLPHTYHHKVPRVSRESFFVTLKPAKPHIVLDSVEVVGRSPIRATRGPFHLPMSIMLMSLMMMMTMMTSSVWSKMMIMMTR